MLKKGLMVLLLFMCTTIICSCDNNQTSNGTLGEDEFTNEDITKEQYPNLLDGKNVGVIADKFYEERLYGSESLTISHVIEATEYGVDGSDMRDDTYAFIAAIEAAKVYTENVFFEIMI